MIPLNYLIQADLAAEYSKFLHEEFFDVMRQRGHKIEFYGDEIMMEQV